MAVTTTPIVMITDSEANLSASLGTDQLGILGAADALTQLVFKHNGKLFYCTVERYGATYKDITANSITANGQFIGDGSQITSINASNVAANTGVTGLTASAVDQALGELNGLVTTLTTAGYLPASEANKLTVTNAAVTGSTGSGDVVVIFTGSTASQVETMPDAAALVNDKGRVITYKNLATVSWTIRQYASNTLDGSSADVALPVGASMTVIETGINTWAVI